MMSKDDNPYTRNALFEATIFDILHYIILASEHGLVEFYIEMNGINIKF